MFVITCPNCGEQKDLKWDSEKEFECMDCGYLFKYEESEMEEYSLEELKARIRELEIYEKVYGK
ncbi:MAG: hypothetical protein ACRC7S_14090 [Cetobacterium sp.]